MAFDAETLHAEVHREFSLAQELGYSGWGEESMDETGFVSFVSTKRQKMPAEQVLELALTRRLGQVEKADKEYRKRWPKRNAEACKRWREKQKQLKASEK